MHTSTPYKHYIFCFLNVPVAGGNITLNWGATVGTCRDQQALYHCPLHSLLSLHSIFLLGDYLCLSKQH